MPPPKGAATGQKDKTIHEDEAGKIKQKLDKANLTLFGTDLRLGNDSRSKKPPQILPEPKKSGGNLATTAASTRETP